MLEHDERKALMKRIGKNLRYCMDVKGKSQEDLIKEIEDKRGYKISQSYISRILSGDANSIPGLALVTICEALEINIQKVFWENLDKEKLMDSSPKEKKSKILFVAKDSEFDKYLGVYHCYFFPTISNETLEEVLHGTLEFKLDVHTRECIANFVVDTRDENGEPDRKKYAGRLILSKSYNCCYCYLINEEFGEISILMFEWFSSNIKSLSCRMAAVLTPSAGGTRDATCHRLFLSKKKLSRLGLSIVVPHLKINTAEIYITETKLKEFFQEMNVPEKFQNTITSLTDPEMFYVLREEHFWGFGNKNMQGYDKKKFITKLREKSNAPNYQKIGKKVDDILYKYLYKSKEQDTFFDENT